MRPALTVLTGFGLPLVFAGIAGLINGYTLAGSVLIVVSLLCWAVWLRLRRESR